MTADHSITAADTTTVTVNITTPTAFTFATDIMEYIEGAFSLVAFKCFGTDDLLAIKRSCVRSARRSFTIWLIVHFFKLFIVFNKIACNNLLQIFVSTECYYW